MSRDAGGGVGSARAAGGGGGGVVRAGGGVRGPAPGRVPARNIGSDLVDHTGTHPVGPATRDDRDIDFWPTTTTTIEADFGDTG